MNIDLLVRLLSDLVLRVEKLERGMIIQKITIPAVTDTTGYLVIKMVASDPATPPNGEIWYNTASNQLKVKTSGGVKAVTLA
jgi:deoxyribose-phosphate aldolase